MPHPWKPWVDVQTGLVPVRGFHSGLGASAPLLPVSVVPNDQGIDVAAAVRVLLVGLAFAAIAGYHGYKRNDSVFWALSWAAGGFVCPVVTLPFAISQGFAKKKG